MKTIPETYQKNGYAYKVVAREGKWAVYEQIHKTAGIVAFEVVKIRYQDGREAKWGTILPGEYLPSTEDWGRIAWTFSKQGVGLAAAKASALERMHTLAANAEPPTANPAWVSAP